MKTLQQLFKGGLSVSLFMIASSVFAQFDLNSYSQRVSNTMFNNAAEIGGYRGKNAGYSHQVSNDAHNVSLWGTMAFGRYLHANLSDQKKPWHGLGVVLNSREYLGENYANAHLTYAFHKAFGKDGSYKKVHLSLAATSTLITSPNDLTNSLSFSAAVKYRHYAFGVSALNMNEPQSEDLLNGFGQLPQVLDFYLEALKFRVGRVSVYPVFYARSIQNQDVEYRAQSVIHIPKITLYAGIGPNGEGMIGFGKWLKKFGIGYYYTSNEFGNMHEWRISFGQSRWKKESDQWD